MGAYRATIEALGRRTADLHRTMAGIESDGFDVHVFALDDPIVQLRRARRFANVRRNQSRCRSDARTLDRRMGGTSRDDLFQRYLKVIADAGLLPAGNNRDLLLRALLLDKAFYESYELNNRPDWVDIPLDGLLRLLTASQ